MNKFPLAVAQFNTTLGVNAVQAFAQRTALVYLPESTLTVSFDFTAAGVMRCVAQLNGHFVAR